MKKIALHKSPISDMSCLPNTPFTLSIDVKGNVKIFDIRNFECLQTISSIKVIEIHSGIIPVSKNAFHTFGNRFKMFQIPPSKTEKFQAGSHLTEAEKVEQRREKQAQYVTFNMYYMMIVVVTVKEIKLYRMKDGLMEILHSNIFGDPTSTI
jgi:hypothetical protein